MGADLFESYVGSIIAAASLACTEVDADKKVALPFWLGGAGIICSMLGYFVVNTKEEGNGKDTSLSSLMWALEKGTRWIRDVMITCATLCFP